MNDEIDWVVVRRFDDPIAAEIAVNFLRDHGLTVALRGNSGSTSVFNRFDTVLDIRVVVPADEEASARATLSAMEVANADAAPGPADGTGDETGGGPYRALPVHTPYETPVRKRMLLAPIIVAMVIPGAGHFYARYSRTGIIVCAGVIAMLAAGLVTGGALVSAALLAMLGDGLAGIDAVQHCNDDRIASKTAQTLRGFAILVGAASVALVLRGR